MFQCLRRWIFSVFLTFFLLPPLYSSLSLYSSALFFVFPLFLLLFLSSFLPFAFFFSSHAVLVFVTAPAEVVIKSPCPNGRVIEYLSRKLLPQPCVVLLCTNSSPEVMRQGPAVKFPGEVPDISAVFLMLFSSLSFPCSIPPVLVSSCLQFALFSLLHISPFLSLLERVFRMITAGHVDFMTVALFVADWFMCDGQPVSQSTYHSINRMFFV